MSMLAINHLLASFDPPCGSPTTFITSIRFLSDFMTNLESAGTEWPISADSSLPFIYSSGSREKATVRWPRDRLPTLRFTQPYSVFWLAAGLVMYFSTGRRCSPTPSAYCELEMAGWQVTAASLDY